MTEKILFFGLSIDETIKKCLLNGMSKHVDKLKLDFKVPDKSYDIESLYVVSLLSLLMMTTTIQVLILEATCVYCHLESGQWPAKSARSIVIMLDTLSGTFSDRQVSRATR